jgi:methyltransferase (TIGR00027 family)
MIKKGQHKLPLFYIFEYVRYHMEKSGILNVRLTDISSTMLITLYCRSLESQSPDPVLCDPKAVEITSALNALLARSNDRMYRELYKGNLDRRLVTFISLRAKEFDEYARDFLSRNPGGAIVNLGCGLDTRFWRIDDGKMVFYDLDLPEVIAIKKQLCGETERYSMIASSVLDFGWMTHLKNHGGRPFLFLAEGLFMYLEEKNVRELVIKLQSDFPGSELVCEVANESVTHGWLKNALNAKMRGQFHLGRGATFLSGIKDSMDIEGWSPGIKFLDEWSYFDANERKLGILNLIGKIPWMRRVQWTARYRL